MGVRVGTDGDTHTHPDKPNHGHGIMNEVVGTGSVTERRGVGQRDVLGGGECGEEVCT